jgi:hypothetical protein
MDEITAVALTFLGIGFAAGSMFVAVIHCYQDRKQEMKHHIYTPPRLDDHSEFHLDRIG